MESNHQPADYKSAALPIEPRQRYGASGENRTLDTRIFSPLLYRLSYRGKLCSPLPLMVGLQGLEPWTIRL